MFVEAERTANPWGEDSKKKSERISGPPREKWRLEKNWTLHRKRNSRDEKQEDLRVKD